LIKPKALFTVVLYPFAVAASLCFMAFGVAVLLGPSRPGQGFWKAEKLSYGVLPLCATPAFLAFTFRRWGRVYTRRRDAWLAACAATIFAVALDSMVFLEFHGRQDERIRVVWQEERGFFSWGTGETSVPAGFTYAPGQGIDTTIGRFTSRDGSLVIQHDIGELAGEHGGIEEAERLTEGSRVRVGSLRFTDANGNVKHFFKVSFPDCGCANFYLESPNEKDAAIIDFIARGFHPIGWTPPFLRPIMPEILRSDCRYRLEWPRSFLNIVDVVGHFVDRSSGQAQAFTRLLGQKRRYIPLVQSATRPGGKTAAFCLPVLR
jgi:hypothetical protein